MESIEHIINRAVSPSAVRSDGYLTHPRSYGVYRIPSAAGSARSYRFGNYPVRMRELKAEFGSCKLEHLFTAREDAKAVALALSGNLS